MPSSSHPAKRRFDPASACVLAAFALACAVAIALRGVPPWTGMLYAAASALCFALYAIDKSAARAGRGRISESTLLTLGLAGGWPGALVAQQVLRHKTAKRTFRLRFWISVVANLGIFAGVVALRAGG